MGRIDRLSVSRVTVEDIRFRSAPGEAGSDANNPHPDYSNPYVTVEAAAGHASGAGIGFTLGRGNDLVCRAVEELAPLVIGVPLEELFGDFAAWWRKLANPIQARWIGPGCGPYHMAAGALVNSLFDLWAKVEGMPLWRLLVSLEPERIVSMLDFRYVEHLLDRSGAIEILRAAGKGKAERVAELERSGLPCYHTTWIGSTTEELVGEIREVRGRRGIDVFKVKIGASLESDRARLDALRHSFGRSIRILTDANQIWSVPQAIAWMKELREFEPEWIEEPVAPDMVEGHRLVREALSAYGIHVVTGENCPNSHVAADLIARGAVDRFQIDACRVMGPPENMLTMLVAARYGVPICPHAGGSGLDELVPHLAAWNYACASPRLDRVVLEQVGFCGRHFRHPSRVDSGRVRLPREPGYLVGMRDESRLEFAFPGGKAWRADGR